MKKYKEILKLSALIVVLPWTIWTFALKGTIKMWKKYTEGKAKLEQLDGQEKASGIAMKESREDRSLLIDGKLLEGMVKIVRGENIGVIRYVPVVLLREGRYGLYAGELVLSGKYAGLLRFVEALRKEMPSVKVISAHFCLFKEKYGDEPELRMTLMLVQMSKDK